MFAFNTNNKYHFTFCLIFLCSTDVVSVRLTEGADPTSPLLGAQGTQGAPGPYIVPSGLPWGTAPSGRPWGASRGAWGDP